MSNLNSLIYFIPEVLIVLSILSVILLGLKESISKYIFPSLYITLTLILAIILLSFNTSFILFEGLIVTDSFSYLFKFIFTFCVLSILIVTHYSSEIKTDLSEYSMMLLSILLGLYLMASSVNLLMIYLAVELVSIPSYILAGFNKNDKASNEASLKYVIFGSFASGLMLFGMSLMYGLSGSLNIIDIHNAIITSANPMFISFTLILVLVGFGYKISMAPFHYWTPDVYEGSPTPVTAFFSVAPKAAGIALFIRFFISIFTINGELNSSGALGLVINWSGIIAILSALTMTIGNFIALHQKSVKRMLAYSSISHIGFILIGFTTISLESITSILLYIIIYLFMTLPAFYMTIVVRDNTGDDSLGSWNGLAKNNSVLAAFMVISLVSLAGLPPTAGFIGKFYLFAAVINAGPAFYWLTFFGALNTVVSLYYYLRVVKAMYLTGEPSDVIAVPSFSMTMIFLLLAIPSVFFGIYWVPVLGWVKESLLLFVQVL